MNPSRSTGQHPPRLGTRAKVHHRSLQSDRRVRPSTFAEVWPIERAPSQRSGQLSEVAPHAFAEVCPMVVLPSWAPGHPLDSKRSGHLHSPSTARNPHAPPDSALTAPLIGLRTKVHHCSLQSDRRVPFEEVCPMVPF